MSMYGRKGAYFGSRKPGFYNFTWIELIGFDNTKPDFGVNDYVKTLGFVPYGVSFHLTSINFVNDHKGMESEYRLPVYACSYSGHTHNDDRIRQDWTNYQLKGLASELHKAGIKVYASFFDFYSRDDTPGTVHPTFFDAHPELCVVLDTGYVSSLIYMTKRFADGTWYEDYLLDKLIQTASDYDFDGIQLADGISSPRLPLQRIEFSDDVVGQFLTHSEIALPEGILASCGSNEEIKKRATWILANYHMEWIKFNTWRWSSFLTKIIKGLKAAGKDAAFNSAWTRDPLEAIYRYGADYRAFVAAGATSIVVEDVSSDLAILEDRPNFRMDYEYRKYVHHDFAATLMQIRACLPDIAITPLYMIRDTLEQWDVLHHMPTAMQRAAAANLNNFMIRPKGKSIGGRADNHADSSAAMEIRPVTNGPYFCLSDGLTKEDWDYTRIMWDNGYTEKIHSVPGITILWSDNRMQAEIDELIKSRCWHTGKWLAELKQAGAPIHKIVRIDEISAAVEGPLLVTNPELLPDKELASVLEYDRGPLLFLGKVKDSGTMRELVGSCCIRATMTNGWGEVVFAVRENKHGMIRDGKLGKAQENTQDNIGKVKYSDLSGTVSADSGPINYRTDDAMSADTGPAFENLGKHWAQPLLFAPACPDFIEKCAEIMTQMSDYPVVVDNDGSCHIEQIFIGPDTMRLLVDNEEYYYKLPVIETGKQIKGIKAITKPEGYPLRPNGSTFRIRVPGRGMDVIEIQI